MATSERIEGETPRGGSYTVVYFLDDAGNPIEKPDATKVEIVEYDDQDQALTRAYAIVQKEGV